MLARACVVEVPMRREPYEKPELIRHRTLKEITLLSFRSEREGDLPVRQLPTD